MKFWLNAFRCWVNRPAWDVDPLSSDGDVYRYCCNCNGFVRNGRHYDMFPDLDLNEKESK